jgi:hypothetical protein
VQISLKTLMRQSLYWSNISMSKFVFLSSLAIVILIVGGRTLMQGSARLGDHPARLRSPSQDKCPAVDLLPIGGKPKKLEILNGILRVKDPFLVFEREGVHLTSSVVQPDYGEATLLQAANGEIFAVGDQTSYQVFLEQKGETVSLNTRPLPTLLRAPCGFWKWFGLCDLAEQERATVSYAVSAVFMSGYDVNEVHKSFVFGLTKEVLDLSNSPTPFYQRDCGSGFVVLIGKRETAIMDGLGTIKHFNPNGEVKPRSSIPLRNRGQSP